MAQEILTFAEQFVIYLTARYIPGKKNILSDWLFHVEQVILTEWSLFPWLFSAILKVPSHEHLSGIFLPILAFFSANIGSKKCAKCHTITGVFLPVLAFLQLLLLLVIGSGS